jgi:hypothetical protein
MSRSRHLETDATEDLDPVGGSDSTSWLGSRREKTQAAEAVEVVSTDTDAALTHSRLRDDDASHGKRS